MMVSPKLIGQLLTDMLAAVAFAEAGDGESALRLIRDQRGPRREQNEPLVGGASAGSTAPRHGEA